MFTLRGHNLLELLDGAGTGGHAAVGDEAGRLVPPLAVQEVDGVLERRGVAVVVLGRHEDHRVGPVDDRAPVLGVLLGVLLEPWVVRLVEQRQPDLSQVGDLDVEPGVGPGPVGEPFGDRLAGAAGAGRADDDRERGHDSLDSCFSGDR
jgi:hypothetical protein